jgi:hypothetical protein
MSYFLLHVCPLSSLRDTFPRTGGRKNTVSHPLASLAPYQEERDRGLGGVNSSCSNPMTVFFSNASLYELRTFAENTRLFIKFSASGKGIYMKENLKNAVATALASMTAGIAGAAEAELDPEVKAITGYTFGQSREPLTALADLVKASKKTQSKLIALERQFAAVLGSDATFECKDFICRQLWIMGSKVSVPALAAMLADDKYADMARYALERNTSQEAGMAIRDALGKTSGKTLVGMINSTGERRDRTSMLALEKLVAGTDEDAAAAAATAVGKIGGAKATSILSRAKQIGTPKVRDAASLALDVMTGKPAARKGK